MDYRHTEAFARDMEAAALRSHALREQALDAFFAAIGRALRRAFIALARRLRGRREQLLPEA